MCRALLLSWLCLALYSAAHAQESPPFAFEWVVGFTPGQMATDVQGNLWITNLDSYVVQRTTRDGHPLYPVPFPSRDVFRNATGWTFLINASSYVVLADSVSVVQAYFSPTGSGIVANGRNEVFTVSEGNPSLLSKFSETGYLLHARSLAFAPFDLAIGQNDVLLTLDRAGGRIARFDRYTRFMDTWPASGARALATDGDGNVYVAFPDHITKLAPDGTLLTWWGEAGDSSGQFRDAKGLALNDLGDVYVSDGATHRILMFGTRLPADDPPPPPPPPVPVPPPCNLAPLGDHPAAVLLHVTSPQTNCMCRGPSSLSAVTTSADPSPDGSVHQFVYLSGVPVSYGIRGLQVAVGYSSALEILSWHVCADFELPDEAWPDSGSADRFAWNECRVTDSAVAGYFEVVARAPVTMRVLPMPGASRVNMSACGFSLDVSPDRLGWISWGGAGFGLDTDGCNPGLTPCQGSTPAHPTTWGRIKTLYRND
jgi:NHL repeat-containing protein